MKLAVILPAAGRSSRFGKTDKLAADLDGRPILLRTVEIFTRRPEVVQIVVAGPPDDFDDFLARYGTALGFHGVTVVPGGRIDRWETVRLALASVHRDCTHIAVHDAARPLVSTPLLDRLLAAAGRLDAVLPAQPLQATLKRIQPAERIEIGDDDDLVADAILGEAGKPRISAVPVEETVDRSQFAEAQTPQIFRRDILDRAYAGEGLSGVTDDAQVVERSGIPVHVVPGEVTNIKVTTAEDLQLVRALLPMVPVGVPRDPLGG